MMASCMAYLMGVSLFNIQEVIREFSGVEHRIEYVDTIDNVRFYNDSKATNTHAACAGLSAFEKNVILLCGGKDKHISFDDLKQYDAVVKKCISFGQTKDKFKNIFSNQVSVETMRDAFEKAVLFAKPGCCVLHVLVLINLKIMRFVEKSLKRWFMIMHQKGMKNDRYY